MPLFELKADIKPETGEILLTSKLLRFWMSWVYFELEHSKTNQIIHTLEIIVITVNLNIKDNYIPSILFGTECDVREKLGKFIKPSQFL